MSLPRKVCLVGGMLEWMSLPGLAGQMQSIPPSAASPAKPASRLPSILIFALALIVLLLVLDISIRTIPAALEDKNQDAGAAQARIPANGNSNSKPFLGSWTGNCGETLIFSSDGSLITVWPASKIQPYQSVTKLTWTEANGILRYSDVAFRWSVSKDGKTVTLIPFNEDGSQVSELAFTLRRQ